MDSSSSIYHSLQIATKTGGKEGLGGALMAGNEEKVPLAGDWASVHPRAQNMSSSFIGGVAPPEMKLPTGLAGSAEEEEDSGRGASWEPSSEVKPPRDPRFEPRAGLAERMAVRTGFNAPTLNTDRIRSGNVGSFSSEAQSPFVTIPPGLSPTSFLDSPVFVSNSLAQPSPTTGKLELDQPRNPSGGSAASPSDSFAFNHLNANNNSVAPPMDLTSKAPMHLGSSNPESPSVGDLSDSLMGDELAENQHDGEGENRGESTLVPAGVQSEDGYNWRKYGQKQVKGSEFPRSYYKCTHPNCQVKKKVERSLEGVTTEITYQGAHNHPKPTLQSRRLAVSPGLLTETVDSLSVPDERAHAPEGILFEAAGGSDLPSNLTNEEEDDEQGGGVEEDELESKRRRMDLASMEMGGASRAVREPRVVVQTTSEVDILDDGYRWRKYGQKVVKGNPNPRSYYKCTNPGCTVRKHVERASHDLKSVITTYEGKHNHDVPAARSSNQSSAGQSGSGNSSGAAVPPAHRRPLQGLPSFDGPPLPPPPLPLGSFAPAGFPLVGQSAMWTLHNGNGWPGSYHPHEDPAAAASQFGSGPASLEGGWYRESQG